ncbi:MAG: hypothetical protein ACLPKT_21560 [Methylocella sp.]
MLEKAQPKQATADIARSRAATITFAASLQFLCQPPLITVTAAQDFNLEGASGLGFGKGFETSEWSSVARNY